MLRPVDALQNTSMPWRTQCPKSATIHVAHVSPLVCSKEVEATNILAEGKHHLAPWTSA